MAYNSGVEPTAYILRAAALHSGFRQRLTPGVRRLRINKGVVMASISTAAPQFLVSALSDAIAFYEERLGFQRDFVYSDFYASISRDGAAIHLKCAPKLEAERAHRKSGEHLDAYLPVSGIDELHE